MRRFFAGIFSFLFVLCAIPFILILAIQFYLFDADFYSDEFNLAVHDVVIHQLTGDEVMGEDFLISKEEYTDLMKGVITMEDVGGIVESLTDQIENGVVDEEGKFSFVVPLGWFFDKQEYIGEKISVLLFENLPKCESGGEWGGDFENLECLPTELAYPDFEAKVLTEVDRSIFSEVPDEFGFDLNLIGYEGVNIPDVVSRFMKMVIFLNLLILFVFAALIALVIYHPLKRILVWEARTVFFASFWSVLLFLPLMYLPVIFEGGEFAVYLGIYDALIGRMAVNMISILGILLVVSLILWIVISRSDDSS